MVCGKSFCTYSDILFNACDCYSTFKLFSVGCRILLDVVVWFCTWALSSMNDEVFIESAKATVKIVPYGFSDDLWELTFWLDDPAFRSLTLWFHSRHIFINCFYLYSSCECLYRFDWEAHWIPSCVRILFQKSVVYAIFLWCLIYILSMLEICKGCASRVILHCWTLLDWKICIRLDWTCRT